MTGVTTSPPAASPNHQVTQTGPNCDQDAKPAAHKVTTPTLALMTVAAPIHVVNFATCAGLSKVCAPPDQRMTSMPPPTASSVLPREINVEVVSVPAVVALAAKAPIKIAGQTPVSYTHLRAHETGR